MRGNDQAEDRFGAALAVGDLDGDEFADLVVGAPGEDREFGRITVDPRRRAGSLRPRTSSPTTTRRTGLPVKLEAGSRFGEAVALRDVDGDGTLDAIAAVPGNAAVITLPGVGDGELTAEGSTALDLPDGTAAVSLGGNGP